MAGAEILTGLIAEGLGIRYGTCPSGMGASTTVIVCADLAGFGNDYFNNKFYIQILLNANSVGNAPETQVRKITDYVSSSGTFTCDAFGANVEENDKIVVMHESLVAIGRDDSDNVFDSSNVVGNSNGSTLERLEQLAVDISGVGGSQTVTVTEQEACVAGDIAVTAGTDVIPFSSLDSLIATEVGAETANPIGGNDSDMAIDWVTNNVAVCVYSDVTVTNHGTATPIRYEADGSVTIGSNFVFLAEDDTSLCDIANVNNGRFVIFYQDSANDGNVKAGQLYSGTLYLSFGAELNIDGNNEISGAAICQADDDKYCLIYNNATNGDGDLEAGSVNSSTLACTAGAAVQFYGSQTADMSICKIDTDKVAAAYSDDGAGDDDGYCVIATLSGLVLTVGTPVEFADATTIAATSIISPDTTHIIIGFEETSQRVDVIAASISGTVPTFGSEVNLADESAATYVQTMAINDTYFMTLWNDGSASITRYSISSLSGNTIAAGTLKALSNDIPPTQAGKSLKINSFNDVVYFGVTGSVTYAVMMDIGWQDGTYILKDIMGVAEDDSGTIIVDGIDEGNASGENPALTYFYDSRYQCVRQKDHGCRYKGYVPRVRVVAPDALKAIGG